MEAPTIRPATGSGRRRVLLVIAALAVVAAAAVIFFVRAAQDLGPPAVGVSEVAVRDNLFAPAAVAVPAGTTMTWRWEGAEDHNVVGDGFTSPTQINGEFAHAFTTPGTYDYQCTLHGFMRGQVVVN